jgi:uncharacterized membrane protein YphA (DoxX/SURF4 family)
MRVRHRIGLNLAPLFLRLMLGALFVQAGLAKLMREAEFAPADAAVLANMGAIAAPGAAAPATPAPGAPGAAPSTPDPATGASPAAPPPAAAAPGQAVTFTEKDFAGPVKARALHQVALSLWRAAHPQGTDGAAPAALWPGPLAEGHRPVWLAWAVTATEAGGGACILIGLLTRFWSVGVAVVMLGAMWLTQIGPAVQAGDTWLGFLPRRDPLDVAAWQGLWVQLALLMSALALAALGAGRLSLDRLIFGARAGE